MIKSIYVNTFPNGVTTTIEALWKNVPVNKPAIILIRDAEKVL